MKYRQRVEILSGCTEMIGKKGTVIAPREYQDGRTWMHRVRFDEPVMVEGVGLVHD